MNSLLNGTKGELETRTVTTNCSLLNFETERLSSHDVSRLCHPVLIISRILRNRYKITYKKVRWLGKLRACFLEYFSYQRR